MGEDVVDTGSTDRPDVPEQSATPVPAGHGDGKTKEEIYLELAKLCQESFQDRRSYEWKAAFGLWAAIGLVTYFAVEHPAITTVWTVAAVGVLYLLLFVAWFFIWQIPIRRAFEQDKAWKHFYMHRAEGLDEERPRGIAYWDVVSNGKHFAWNYGQSLITLLFLLGSFVIVYNSMQAKPSEGSKIELKASGDAIKVTTEASQK